MPMDYGKSLMYDPTNPQNAAAVSTAYSNAAEAKVRSNLAERAQQLDEYREAVKQQRMSNVKGFTEYLMATRPDLPDDLVAQLGMAYATGNEELAVHTLQQMGEHDKRKKLAGTIAPPTAPGMVQGPDITSLADVKARYQQNNMGGTAPMDVGEGPPVQMPAPQLNMSQLPTRQTQTPGMVPQPQNDLIRTVIEQGGIPALAALNKMQEGKFSVHVTPNGDIVRVDNERGTVNVIPSTQTGIKPKQSETINDFAVFYRGYKESHPGATETEISEAWHKQKVAEAKAIGEARIPAFTQAQPGIPVGYVFNRRAGTFEWKGQGPRPPMDPEAAATYKADVKSLENLQKQADMTEQAIKQADKNAEALNATSAQFARSNYPAPNRLITLFGTQLGDAKTQAEIGRFKVALLAFSREYMRVVTGAARSVTELSIKAQGTADDVLSKFDSWAALNAKVQQARIEMANTSKSYREQVGEIKGRLGMPGGGPGNAPSGSDPYGIR